MAAQPRDIRRYVTSAGEVPFAQWLDSLQDIKAKTKIAQRLNRVSLGNLGDYKSVGEGVYKLPIDYASGYRIYFGQIGTTIILILCGGDKKTQAQDISKIIGGEKMPVSDSYHDSLIESLKDPHYAAVYLETHLEGDEYEFEPELLKLALSHVLEAFDSQNLTPEQIKIQVKQLEELMEKPGKEAIHHLELWLKSLGLKLTVTVAPEMREINHQNDVLNPVGVIV